MQVRFGIKFCVARCVHGSSVEFIHVVGMLLLLLLS